MALASGTGWRMLRMATPHATCTFSCPLREIRTATPWTTARELLNQSTQGQPESGQSTMLCRVVWRGRSAVRSPGSRTPFFVSVCNSTSAAVLLRTPRRTEGRGQSEHHGHHVVSTRHARVAAALHPEGVPGSNQDAPCTSESGGVTHESPRACPNRGAPSARLAPRARSGCPMMLNKRRQNATGAAAGEFSQALARRQHSEVRAEHRRQHILLHRAPPYRSGGRAGLTSPRMRCASEAAPSVSLALARALSARARPLSKTPAGRSDGALLPRRKSTLSQMLGLAHVAASTLGGRAAKVRGDRSSRARKGVEPWPP